MSDFIAKAEKIVRARTVHGGLENIIPYCVLGLIDIDGNPALSAITAAKSEGIRSVCFCTGLASPKVERIKNNSKAAVCFCSEDYNISLSGRIEIITDQAVKNEMWYAPLSHHFSGPADPEYCVLKLQTERYNLLLDYREFRGTLNE